MPTEVSQKKVTFASISLPIRKKRLFKIIIYIYIYIYIFLLFDAYLKFVPFEILKNQILIYHKVYHIWKLRYRVQPFVETTAIEVATSFHWLSFRSP